MKKKVRKVSGTCIGITFTKEEQEIRGIKVGSVLDLTDMIVEDEVPKK